jgi:hypothetical protein
LFPRKQKEEGFSSIHFGPTDQTQLDRLIFYPSEMPFRDSKPLKFSYVPKERFLKSRKESLDVLSLHSEEGPGREVKASVCVTRKQRPLTSGPIRAVNYDNFALILGAKYFCQALRFT